MKKRHISVLTAILIVVMLFAAFVMTGCEEKIIISEGSNHKVFQISEISGRDYLYEIYSDSGKLVERDTTFRIEPTITYHDDKLIEIKISVGTGFYYTHFYDREGDKFSESFDVLRAAAYGKIVYVSPIEDRWVLIVRDIFDETEYYKEFYLDFIKTADPYATIRLAEFIDEQNLRIVYVSGDEYDEIEAVLSLNPQ